MWPCVMRFSPVLITYYATGLIGYLAAAAVVTFGGLPWGCPKEVALGLSMPAGPQPYRFF